MLSLTSWTKCHYPLPICYLSPINFHWGLGSNPKDKISGSTALPNDYLLCCSISCLAAHSHQVPMKFQREKKTWRILPPLNGWIHLFQDMTTKEQHPYNIVAFCSESRLYWQQELEWDKDSNDSDIYWLRDRAFAWEQSQLFGQRWQEPIPPLGCFVWIDQCQIGFKGEPIQAIV